MQAQAKDYDPKAHGETFPRGTTVTYEFAAKGGRGPVKLIWFEGEEKIPRPDDLEPGRKVPGTGAIVIGDKGKITYGSHGAGGVRLFPETKMRAYKQPAQTLRRVPGHFEDWLAAVRSGGVAGSNFDYGGPLTEIALLGMIGLKHVGRKLEWDAENMLFANHRTGATRPTRTSIRRTEKAGRCSSGPRVAPALCYSSGEAYGRQSLGGSVKRSLAMALVDSAKPSPRPAALKLPHIESAATEH